MDQLPEGKAGRVLKDVSSKQHNIANIDRAHCESSQNEESKRIFATKNNMNPIYIVFLKLVKADWRMGRENIYPKLEIRREENLESETILVTCSIAFYCRTLNHL